MAGLPHDLEAERQVLGSLLLRPELVIPVSAIVSDTDFYVEAHKLIYHAIVTLHDEAADIDPVRVVQRLDDKGMTTRAGGAPYIVKLAQDIYAPGNAPAHARRIKGLALRRDLIEITSSIQKDAQAGQDDENAFLKRVEDSILNITNRSFVHGIVHVRDLKKDFTKHIESLMEAKGGLTGQATHFSGLDELTSGLHEGELIVLAARPGVGKTTFAMNIAANVAMKDKRNVLVFSLEMSRLELLVRFLCAEALVDQSDMKRGHLRQEKVKPMLDAIESIFTSPIHIDDTGTLEIWDCITRTRKLALDLANRGESLSLIVIDYLQLVADPESRKQGRQQEVASISRSLKQLAKNVKAPIIAISQMNRSVEQRRGESARPQLSDLRESGAIEQDADIVMFIHKEVYNPEDPDA
ncbi:MAG: replicative DNA helicase, partial [Spirochaetia bacterium]|nr:replicative DNA helicase [Spirochaetia bacterium]